MGTDHSEGRLAVGQQQDWDLSWVRHLPLNAGELKGSGGRLVEGSEHRHLQTRMKIFSYFNNQCGCTSIVESISRISVLSHVYLIQSSAATIFINTSWRVIPWYIMSWRREMTQQCAYSSDVCWHVYVEMDRQNWEDS